MGLGTWNSARFVFGLEAIARSVAFYLICVY